MPEQTQVEDEQALFDELNQAINEELRAGRFSGKAKLEKTSIRPAFEASIGLKEMNEINVGYNPEYEKEHPQRTKRTIRDITRHEINHRRYANLHGCPRTLEFHVEKIVEPMSPHLTANGFSTSDIHYSANALEDSILHQDLNSSFNLDGIVDFFEEVGKFSKEQRYTDFYDAHVHLNLMLFGNKQQRKRLNRYFVSDKEKRKKITEVITGFLTRTGIADIKQEIGGKQIRDRKKIRDFLNNEENWPQISRIYAEEFSKLMQPGYAMPIPNHSGEGTKGNPVQAPSEKEGNEFDREMESPVYKEGRIKRAYEEDTGTPKWMNPFESLDTLYQLLAKRLIIKVKSFTQEGKFPIAYYGKRSFDPERDNLKHTEFGTTDEGEFELKKKRWYIDTPLDFKHEPIGFPEIRFGLFDTSGSMQGSPDGTPIGKTSIIPWGDNSKYHYSLLAWYGLLEYLKENHILHQSSVSIGNFGSKTRIARGLKEAKKLALSPQFSNSTKLSLDEASELFNKRGMLLFTVSDGYIDNWRDIKDKFIQGAKKHHYFHLQIGEPNDFSTDLQAAGLTVRYVRGKYDLANTVIDITDK